MQSIALLLADYFKRLCISGAADRIAALQEQICGLTAQLADGQTTLYYSEAVNLRLTAHMGDQNRLISFLTERVRYYSVLTAVETAPFPPPNPPAAGRLSALEQEVATLRAAHTQRGRLLVYLLQRPTRALPPPQEPAVNPAARLSDPTLQYDTLAHSLNLQGVLERVVPLTYALLSVRTANALQRAHVVTLNELALLTPQKILLLPNVGATTLQEIAQHLDTRWSQLPADYFQQPTSPQQDDRDALHEHILQLTETLSRYEADRDTLQQQLQQAQDVTRTLREQVAAANGRLAQLQHLLPTEESPGQVLQLPEAQHRPLQAALNLPGLLQATVPLAALGLSTRSCNTLFRCGNIQTLNDLLNWTHYDLLQLRDSGPKTTAEVEDRLRVLWPQLPPQYFQRTVTHAGAAAAAWRVQPPYGRPRY